ncbi:hypothetical protein J5226_22645 [Lysobacter sp. K5869]|uniref:hypothetical protein n=1 Tax=Lysobacter sp. K5869 TaxID=2820808 RepID=UPI001C062A5E|nr:hypothetical protein [Lysobacter sp. K5869]QWP76351.1 hypothetical protein J5226_22645 [Lysobacter sp. K5869]
MEQFLHIRVLLGIVLGLAVATLLKGLARFVQHPGRERPYWVHIAWALSMFTLLAHFWWWEFSLIHVERWSFLAFSFLVGYVVVLFVLCTLLFPDDIRDYTGWRDYFYSRRHWFFGIMALSYAIDFGDTLIKGTRYFEAFGLEYPLRNLAYVVLCLIAMRTRSERFHAAFAVAGLLYQASWIYRLYDFVS